MRKRSPFHILYLVLFAGIFVSFAFAQQNLKIGVINSQEVLDKSIEGKKVIVRLEERRKQSQANLAKLDDEIRQLETKLNTQRLTLTEEAVLQYSSDLDRKRTERQRMGEDSYRDLQELSNRLFTKLQGELLPIIEQIGKEKGLDIIFDLGKSGAVWWSPTIDITAEVIKKYDAAKASPAK